MQKEHTPSQKINVLNSDVNRSSPIFTALLRRSFMYLLFKVIKDRRYIF